MSEQVETATPGPRRESRRVRELPNALIDQIAAGEVVERPASVVKELVENALDAGASRLRVEVRGGGADWIAVTDDGFGMTVEDARMALRRHATSKIAAADDLERIGTYGFRGEALPAIASVSRLRLCTRRRGSAGGVELRVTAGVVEDERASGTPEGTRVEVADLFASIPARRKFLKSAATEWGHCADWLARAALALPAVHFDIHRDERKALVWPATDDALDRTAAVLGESDAAAFVPVAHREGPYAVHGHVSRPDRHRATMAGIHLFVNQRPVRDRVLQHALVDVYRDVLPRGRFPTAVLFLEVPLDAVDVNVHPAKWEVRFAEPRALHRLVRHAVVDAIGARAWIAPGEPEMPDAPRSAGHGPPRADRGPSTSSDWIFAGDRRTSAGAEPARAHVMPALPGMAPAASAAPDRAIRFAGMRRLGQFRANYLLLENDEQLLLVDQHAAHERVLYERIRAEWSAHAVASQGLLAPSAVRLSPRAHASLLEARESLARLGFDVDAFGEATVAVRAVPALLAERDPEALVRELADALADSESGPEALRAESRALEAADRIFASLACHSARRKGDHLDEREQRALLEALDAIPWAPTCPHGRPVAVPIEIAEIERRFGRR